MARILFTWELGEGSGHTTPYLDLINRLQDRGHEVAFALRYLHRANSQFRAGRTRWFQAPLMLARHVNVSLPVDSYARILHNNGYDTLDHLSGLIAAWKNLYDLLDPDLLIFDYSPTAMLAARATRARRLAIGTGFHLPPRVSPMPGIGDAAGNGARQARLDLEARLLGVINGALAQNAIAPLASFIGLLDADQTLLRTLPELDHYQGRGAANYVGILKSPGGAAPQWPAVSGPRVFAYLKDFKTLPTLLESLNALECATLVYGDNLHPDYIERYSSASLHFVSRPLDMTAIGRSAALGICHANHGTTTELLLAGVPLLLLPLYGEQSLVARNVERLGAGLSAPKLHPQGMREKLGRLLREPAFRQAAQRFAETYRGARGRSMTESVITSVEALLA